MIKRTLFAAAAACIVLSATAADARPAPPAARAFAQRVVATLNTPPAERWGVPETAEWYDAGWLRLLSESARLATALQVTPPMEGNDPLCNCNHPGFRYAVGAMTQRPDGVVVVQLRANNGSDWSAHPVHLRRVAGRWVIWNAITDDTDWRREMTRQVACLQAARTHEAAERCAS